MYFSADIGIILEEQLHWEINIMGLAQGHCHTTKPWWFMQDGDVFLRNSLNIGLFLANQCTEKHTYKALILPSLASNCGSIEVLLHS